MALPPAICRLLSSSTIRGRHGACQAQVFNIPTLANSRGSLPELQLTAGVVVFRCTRPPGVEHAGGSHVRTAVAIADLPSSYASNTCTCALVSSVIRSRALLCCLALRPASVPMRLRVIPCRVGDTWSMPAQVSNTYACKSAEVVA